MKAILPLFSLCTLLAFSGLHAQDYSPNRWKETSRLNQDDKEVSYTDTVLLNTVDRNLIDLIIGGYAYRGTVNGDSLDVKKRVFQVVKNEPETIWLKYGKLTHIFTRELKGTAAADAEAFADQNKIPDEPVKKVNSKQLYGTWMVYKKTVREGAEIDIKKVQYLKKLEFFKQAKKGSRGNLTTASNLMMKIKDIKASEIKILTTLNQEKSLKVLKQSPAELLLEDENNVIYFLKKY